MVLLLIMGQSLTHLLVHAIFSTKDRRPFLRSEEIRNEIYAYMFGIETPEGRTPFQGALLDVTSPRAKAPGLFCQTAPRS
jgi:hypothetical protein